MHPGVSKKTLGTILVYLFFMVLIAAGFPASLTDTAKQLYVTLGISYLVFGALVCCAIIKHRVYLFEPFTIISVLYAGIFVYRPQVDVINERVSYLGYSVLEGGVKATVLFTLGYIAFYLGYFCKKKDKKPRLMVKNYNDDRKPEGWLVVLWFVLYALCLASMLSRGVNLRYIFSLGSEGSKVSSDESSGLLFLSNFALSLLPLWLMIMTRPFKMSIKIGITVLLVIYLLVRNGRWLILILLLAPICYKYIKAKKAPKVRNIVLLGLLALIIFAYMQTVRSGLATGRGSVLSGWGEEGLTIETLLSPFDSDLTTYTTFYGEVMAYPENAPYVWGQTFIYVFILAIPRAIWPGKPDNPIRDLTENALGAQARANGRAVANIGEAYMNFGAIGVIAVMFLFGYIASRTKELYKKPTEDRLIMYSVLFPLFFQWVARGNFSGNFYYTLFTFVPVIAKAVMHGALARKR